MWCDVGGSLLHAFAQFDKRPVGVGNIDEAHAGILEVHDHIERHGQHGSEGNRMEQIPFEKSSPSAARRRVPMRRPSSISANMPTERARAQTNPRSSYFMRCCGRGDGCQFPGFGSTSTNAVRAPPLGSLPHAASERVARDLLANNDRDPLPLEPIRESER